MIWQHYTEVLLQYLYIFDIDFYPDVCTYILCLSPIPFRHLHLVYLYMLPQYQNLEAKP